MNSTFAKVFLDEDVDLIIADILRSHGFEVETAQGAGRKSMSDAEQLTYASDNGMLILTHNRDDYAELVVEWFEAGKEHYGVISAVQRPPNEVVHRLMNFLERFTADQLKNQFLMI